jgi:hypothetical protein
MWSGARCDLRDMLTSKLKPRDTDNADIKCNLIYRRNVVGRSVGRRRLKRLFVGSLLRLAVRRFG